MDHLERIITLLQNHLLFHMNEDGVWDGHLSSSAVSTSVACFALHSIDRERYAPQIEAAAGWLHRTMLPEGCWGDSPESRPNMTATLLSYAALHACHRPPKATLRYLEEQFGGASDHHIIRGVLGYYGKDLTFSAPILVMCAAAGVIHSWRNIPQLPFELALLPQRMYRFMRLPVVSYAIPALIAVGILRHRRGARHALYSFREGAINKCLRVLAKLQPVHGGFLEAAPLTAFVAMCMAHAGYGEHPATARCAAFLTSTVREDGSWPIDTDLGQWNTALAVLALEERVPDKHHVAAVIKSRQFKEKHPFTGAQPGGWGWTGRPGAVPDADDTAAALIALHALDKGVCSPEVCDGIRWLLSMQNRDGGIPTFCKGWGKLPFDRSAPDISAHTLKAFHLWEDALPRDLRQRVRRATGRILDWLFTSRRKDGSWLPLWFGDQEAPDGASPVYGTAVVVEHLASYDHTLARQLVHSGSAYLGRSQNPDGGWGGAPGAPSKIIVTARVVSAIIASHARTGAEWYGANYLCQRFANGIDNVAREPVGLYFARLWYSERLYGLYFPLLALKKMKRQIDSLKS